MRTTVALLVCIFCASLTWGQYSTAYQTGVTDITSYLPTTNAWKALPVKTLISEVISGDGSIYVLDSSGCAFSYSYTARTYTQQSSWGCGWSETTTEYDSSHGGLIVGVLKTDAGCASGTKRFYWSYSGAAPTNTGNCASHWYGASDTSQLQLARTPAPPGFTNGHSFFWDGTSYYDIGTGWTAGYVADQSTACAIKAGNVYQLTATAVFTQLAAQPSGGATGCAIYGPDTTIFTWNASGVVSRYDIAQAVWTAVVGTMRGLSAVSKAETIGLDASGHPFHLNVYAGYTSGTTTGSYTLCPNVPCPPSTSHTITLQVKYPNGLAGAWGSITAQPTTNVNVNSFDFAPDCDPFFGDPADPQCHVGVAGEAHCNASNTTLATPPPYTPRYNYSEDYVVYDDRKVIGQAVPYQNAYKSDYLCYVHGACKTGTAPACPAADIHGSAIMPTPELAVSVAARQCLLGPWTTLSVYPPGSAPSGCVKMTVDHPAKVPGQCF